MKLNCKRIDFTYTPGEEIFNFPGESGLPFIFDVEEELTGDPAAMDAVGEMLDEAENKRGYIPASPGFYVPCSESLLMSWLYSSNSPSIIPFRYRPGSAMKSSHLARGWNSSCSMSRYHSFLSLGLHSSR